MPATAKHQNPKKKKLQQRTPVANAPISSEREEFRQVTNAKLLVIQERLERVEDRHPEKLAKLRQLSSDYERSRHVEEALKFHEKEIIAKHVTFGRVVDYEGELRYAFTCVISLQGDVERIFVPKTSVSPLIDALNMVTTGFLEITYKEVSRDFFKTRVREYNNERRTSFAKKRAEEAKQRATEANEKSVAAALEEAREVLAMLDV
jgi:nitrogen regulatory protein PII-like uncharacterized protein